MSQVIARRYRPQAFDQVVGQGAIVRTLANAIERGRVAHGFVFSGQRGVGKTTLARLLAKCLNCQAQDHPTVAPCGECDSCREIREGNAVDVIEIDAASNRGIEEIRALRERVRYRPARDRYKIFILDEAHQLTEDAFNALLKTLEEPPEWAVFVLATTEPEALPATIRSRCQHYAFRAVAFQEVLELLRSICAREGMAADEEALGLIAEAGEGSVRDALSLLDQAIAYGGERLDAASVRQLLGRVEARALGELMAAVAAADARILLERAGALLGAGVGAAPLCRQLAQFSRNMLVAKTSGGASELLELTETERAAAVEGAAHFSEEELARFLQILLRTAGELRYGQQERLHLEMGLLKMLHARGFSRLEDVLAALETGGEPAAKPQPSAAGPPRPAAPRGIPERTAPSATSASGTAAATATLEPAAPPRLFAGEGRARAVSAPAAAKPNGSVERAPEPRLAAQSVNAERTPEPRLAAQPVNFGAAATAAAAEPTPEGGAEASAGGATAAVLALLREQGRSSLISVLELAQWTWTAEAVTLRWASAHADGARAASAAGQQKALREACRQALGRALEVRLEMPAPGAAAAVPTLAGTPEERAEAHPLLQRLRAQLPARVLRTRALAEE